MQNKNLYKGILKAKDLSERQLSIPKSYLLKNNFDYKQVQNLTFAENNMSAIQVMSE